MKTNQDSFESQVGVPFSTELLETWAEFFTTQHAPEFAMHGADLLNIAKLDYSIDSLRQVDEFLSQVRRAGVPKSGATHRLVIRCGAYVGEVMRRSESPGVLTWIPLGNLRSERANTVVPAASLENFVALCSISRRFSTFPFAKVSMALFVEDCSVWEYASVVIRLCRTPREQGEKFCEAMEAKFPEQPISVAMMDAYLSDYS